jgi:hypothetical protein
MNSPSANPETGALSLPAKNPWPCLTKEFQPDDVVSATPSKGGTGSKKVVKITLGETLKSLRVRCRKGKLVDGAGKGIYVYRLQGCWGNPPEDYQEILQRQRNELESLRQRYHVIELTCNASGVPIP